MTLNNKREKHEMFNMNTIQKTFYHTLIILANFDSVRSVSFCACTSMREHKYDHAPSIRINRAYIVVNAMLSKASWLALMIN
jgi:hypothetical protein